MDSASDATHSWRRTTSQEAANDGPVDGPRQRDIRMRTTEPSGVPGTAPGNGPPHCILPAEEAVEMMSSRISHSHRRHAPRTVVVVITHPNGAGW